MAERRTRKPVEGNDRAGKPLDADQDGIIDIVDDVVEVQPPTQEEDQRVFAKATEEFNEHVKSLVRLFFEQQIQGLDERIRDLEGVVADLANSRGQAGTRVLTPEEMPSHYEAPDYVSEAQVSHEHQMVIPEYVQEHQSGSTVPWFKG